MLLIATGRHLLLFKVRCQRLRSPLVNFVKPCKFNTILTEPFHLGRLNFVHILLMTRGHLLIFKDRGEKTNMLNMLANDTNTDTMHK